MSSTDASLSLRVTQPGPIPLAAQFQCAPGELLALVGPSGSGKTTLLRAIAGLYHPTEGYISIGDETWLDTQRNICRRPQQRRVGFVFQDYALFPHLTALGNVMAAMGHVPRHLRRDRAKEWLARVRLEGLEQRHPAQLSGGQRQRVAVARALAREPRALLLDEPFSAVDQVTRRRLQRELALLRDAIDIPMVLVTHDLEEAGALADRLCVLHGGRSLQSGPPDNLFRRPASAEVAWLLDRHNVFSGHKVNDSGRARLAWGPYRLDVGKGLEDCHEERVLQWYIPPSDVVMHRRDRPSWGDRENPVTGEVREMIVMGGMTQLSLGFAHTDETLRFEMGTHGARRNGLARGVSVDVTLLAEGIHVMPFEDGQAAFDDVQTSLPS